MRFEFISEMSENSHSPSFATSEVTKSAKSTSILDSTNNPRLPTWPHVPSFSDNDSDVLRTLLHFASKVERRCQNQVRVCPPHLDFRVEPFDVHLCSGQGLLSCVHAFAQFRYFCHHLLVISIYLWASQPTLIDIYADESAVRKRVLRDEVLVLIFQFLPELRELLS